MSTQVYIFIYYNLKEYLFHLLIIIASILFQISFMY